MKVKIKRLVKKPVQTKNGPATNVAIQDELTGTWVSGFERPEMSTWYEGMELEVPVKQNGQYVNFDFPKGNYQQNTTPSASASKDYVKLESIEKKLDEILSIIKPTYSEPPNANYTSADEAPPHTDEDAPF